MSWFKKQKRQDFYPVDEVIYPNAGGWIGFSLTIWDTRGASMDRDVLVSNWGGVENTKRLGNSPFVMEARFFAFGRLLKQNFRKGNSLEELKSVSKDFYNKWKPVIDEITEKESKLLREPGRTYLHIDEVVDRQLKARI